MYYIIYQITNLINNKIYIGAHATDSLGDDYLGSGWLIKKAVEKYGANQFRKDILFIFDSADKMFEKEKELVNKEFLKRADIYNLAEGGNGGFRGAEATKQQSMKMRGRTRSLESRIKQPLTSTGRKDPPELAAKKRETLRLYRESHPGANKGRKRPLEAIKKTTEKLIGQKRSTETIEKQKASMKAHYENNPGPNKGRVFTREQREHMSLAHKGKKTNRGRPVKNMDTNKEFLTIDSAAEYYGLLATGIRAACQGKQKTCGGFLWQFISSYEKDA